MSDITRIFRYEQISATVAESPAMLQLRTGLHHVEYTQRENILGQLVHQLNAFVQTEPAGDEVTDSVVVMLPLKPRWMPKFLWKRIPTRRAIFHLRCQPLWAYPDSSYIAPLGRPFPIEHHKLDMDDPSWR